MKKVFLAQFVVLGAFWMFAPLLIIESLGIHVNTVVSVIWGLSALVIPVVVYPYFYNSDETPKQWWSRRKA